MFKKNLAFVRSPQLGGTNMATYPLPFTGARRGEGIKWARLRRNENGSTIPVCSGLPKWADTKMATKP